MNIVGKILDQATDSCQNQVKIHTVSGMGTMVHPRIASLLEHAKRDNGAVKVEDDTLDVAIVTRCNGDATTVMWPRKPWFKVACEAPESVEWGEMMEARWR
jgi:hypothetical protein